MDAIFHLMQLCMMLVGSMLHDNHTSSNADLYSYVSKTVLNVMSSMKQLTVQCVD